MTASACAKRRDRRRLSRCRVATEAANGLAGSDFGPRFFGASASNTPASRCRRQSVRAEEYSPSRRRMAVIPPVFAARSVSSRIRSLSLTVRFRRDGRFVNSGVVATGGGTTVDLRLPFAPSAAVTSLSGFEIIGMIDVNLLRPQV